MQKSMEKLDWEIGTKFEGLKDFPYKNSLVLVVLDSQSNKRYLHSQKSHTLFSK